MDDVGICVGVAVILNIHLPPLEAINLFHVRSDVEVAEGVQHIWWFEKN